MTYSQSIVDRLYSNADKSGECWLWLGAKDRDGYGRMRIGQRRSMRVHRLSWEIANQSTAGELLVCHRCDVPACVNPDHLYLGTAKQNFRDAMNRGRWLPQHGEKVGTAKLTARQAKRVVRLYKTGKYRQVDIAAMMNVSQTAIQLLLSGKNWPSVVDAPIPNMRRAPKKSLRKLSDRRKKSLIAEYLAGGISQVALAKKYSVSQQYVSLAVSKLR